MSTGWIVLGVIVVLVFLAFSAYNRLVALGQRVGGMRLDLEPDLETRLRLPDGGHFRAGIAGDHRELRIGRGGARKTRSGRSDFTLRFSKSGRPKPPFRGIWRGKPAETGGW